MLQTPDVVAHRLEVEAPGRLADQLVQRMDRGGRQLRTPFDTDFRDLPPRQGQQHERHLRTLRVADLLLHAVVGGIDLDADGGKVVYRADIFTGTAAGAVLGGHLDGGGQAIKAAAAGVEQAPFSA